MFPEHDARADNDDYCGVTDPLPIERRPESMTCVMWPLWCVRQLDRASRTSETADDPRLIQIVPEPPGSIAGAAIDCLLRAEGSERANGNDQTAWRNGEAQVVDCARFRPLFGARVSPSCRSRRAADDPPARANGQTAGNARHYFPAVSRVSICARNMLVASIRARVFS